MADLARLAWRNLGRNPRRTVITGSALAVGIALSVATYGLMDGYVIQIVRALTRFDLGHIQAHHEDFLGKRSLDLTLKNAGAIDAALKGDARTVATAERVYAGALASHGTKSVGAQIVGVDPRREPQVTTLHETVERGRYLDAEPTPWPRGRALTARERKEDERLTKRAEDAILDELDDLEPLAGEGKPAPGGAAKAPASAPTSARAGGQADRQRTLQLANKLSPPPRRPPEVLIGAKLARLLKAKVGDQIYVITQAVDGASAEVSMKVRGVFHTGTESFDRRILMHLADLQTFVHLGDKVHEIAALTTSAPLAKEVTARVKAALGAALRPPKGQPMVVQSWDEIRPDILKLVLASRAGTAVMVFVIVLVATLGVVNTMLMSIFERTREIGVLKAIGMSGGRILRMVVAETVLLTIASAVLGTGVGLLLDAYLVRYGIDLTGFTEGISIGGVNFDPIWRASVTAEGVLAPTLILMICSLLASFYPAIRAARLQPAVGMREL